MFFDIWRQKTENIIATPISNTDRTLRLRKFCWLNLGKNQRTSRKPKNQKTKTFQRMFGLRLMFVFFFGFPRVFLVFFGHDLEETKKLKVFLDFLKELLLEVRQKTKKTQVFFGFWTDFWKTCNNNPCKKPKKDLSFLVFHNFSNHQFFQKNKKTLSFFSFFKVMTKKNKKNRGKPKKKKHEPQTKHSLKSFGFLVFWFSRGFVKIILLIEKSFIKGRVFTTLHNFLKI